MIDNYMGMIRKIAWSFHRSTGIEYEDLLQECFVIWYNIVEPRYNPKRCAFTTWAQMCLTTNLITIANKQKKAIKTVSLDDDFDREDNKRPPDEQVEFMNRIWNLSAEARFIVSMVFESPQQFLSQTKGEITENLVRQGWTWGAAKRAIREIAKVLAN
jgi:DNA-directed RNA polymerase specialized sigma24 family protein